jgi:nucleoside-diphosphate-sugar epimerase
MVHVSTEAVLARGTPIVMADETAPTVTAQTGAGVYSITKAEAEKAALEMKNDQLEVLIVRPRMIWGKDDSVMLPGFLEATRTGMLQWFDGGLYRTSTCHVTNVCEGIWLACQRVRDLRSNYAVVKRLCW